MSFKLFLVGWTVIYLYHLGIIYKKYDGNEHL